MNKVKLVAVWDFSGPEGSSSGRGKGLVKKGTVFHAEPNRATFLAGKGIARRVSDIPEQEPESNTEAVERYEGTPLTRLTVTEVMEVVNEGLVSPEEALAIEESQKNPRVTLVRELRELIPDDDTD